MFNLQEIVPWGRSFDEYRQVFALTDNDLQKTILGCGDGPAEFNCELSRRGGKIISVDPLYDARGEDIRKRISLVFETVMDQIEENRHEFCWNQISSPENLAAIRKTAMDGFLADYEDGRKQSRYQAGSLPKLSFNNNSFDLTLVSHLIFLYSEQFDLAWHIAAIKELIRVSHEIRIFPLLELGSQKSRHLDGVCKALEECEVKFIIKQVNYEFQRGGNEMLVITKPLK